MSESYFLQLYQPFNPVWSYEIANKHISNLLTVVKRKMAKLSPVLILQRHVRGWLVRKNIPIETGIILNRIKHNLYKWFRPFPWKPSNMPNMKDPSYWFMLKALQAPPPTAQTTFLPPLLEQTNIDFSKLATSINRKLQNQSIRRFERKFSQGSQSGKTVSTLTSHSITSDHVAKRYSRTYAMFLQLQKLKSNSWRLLNASAPTFGHLYKSSSNKHRKRLRRLSQGSMNISETTSQYDDVSSVVFRDQYGLVSRREPIISLDLYREMLFNRRDTGTEIRQAAEDIHDLQRFYSKSNVQKILKKPPEGISTDPPMNVRQLECIMKRAAGNKNRQKEFKERRENVEKIKEQSQLGKIGAEVWREKSRDTLNQLGRRKFEENKEFSDRIKLEEAEANKLRVQTAREHQLQAKEKRAKLIEATINSSNTKEAKLLLSDEKKFKILKEITKKRLQVEKAKNTEKQSIHKILQKSIDRTRKIQSIRVAEKEQLIEKMIIADNKRQLDNKQRIKNVKTPNENEILWTREGITPSYHLPKGGSISPICGRNSIQIKCGAQINLASLQTGTET
ncbi:Leucine-rich repeat and IQ domain-containing protein 3 [Oopsacas minuta]|uniref:Leucine-rich repeat and IQ domain-containing protein 3 n=1 Tax=Oopsacas minuta TaxID=111878 RepID=A0AAV7KBY6_9METZ|nr:Leucine-rich repeat and IQ domain-containing protein 3 [Oopsacas minuta]